MLRWFTLYALAGLLLLGAVVVHQRARSSATASVSTAAAAATASVSRATGVSGASGATSQPAAAKLSESERYAAKVREVQRRAPAGFTVVSASPFVVAGDETPEVVQRRARDTVTWAVAMLQRDFFPKLPTEILEVWLFKDKTSYEKHVRELFQDTPTTPFGYYSRRHGALIMNIATGGGTLVHEIVHPLMQANLPDCPPWYNEGLGSLFEQSGARDGHIIGYPNWRLPGLQQAIRQHTLPGIDKLLAMDEDEFYGEDSGRHYAMARYLLYYLQEKGLLVKYHQTLSRTLGDDPTGRAALEQVLGTRDLPAFQRAWEPWVLTLRFP